MFTVMRTYTVTSELQQLFISYYVYKLFLFYFGFANITSELQFKTLKSKSLASVFTGHRRGGRPRDFDHVSETGAPGAERLWQRDAPHVSQLQL
jgi:hypothetical protein